MNVQCIGGNFGSVKGEKRRRQRKGTDGMRKEDMRQYGILVTVVLG